MKRIEFKKMNEKINSLSGKSSNVLFRNSNDYHPLDERGEFPNMILTFDPFPISILVLLSVFGKLRYISNHNIRSRWNFLIGTIRWKYFSQIFSFVEVVVIEFC